MRHAQVRRLVAVPPAGRVVRVDVLLYAVGAVQDVHEVVQGRGQDGEADLDKKAANGRRADHQNERRQREEQRDRELEREALHDGTEVEAARLGQVADHDKAEFLALGVQGNVGDDRPHPEVGRGDKRVCSRRVRPVPPHACPFANSSKGTEKHAGTRAPDSPDSQGRQTDRSG